ncbi:Putative competence-damage protein [Granulibacter bethesdensis]|uniref:Competence-damage protein n=1 Tax=Granulibacter bethesdensis TaxID=364410 RepID=A0AAC9P8B9_9PROT|nr:molybdopterin-binding protein [Granulibacter bethesdensis]APH53869.1 Putative competence-damage protein [Granulibacter bethesdensis]APH61447.1 Putative competence-damage protein [Granulibacter bethesdensis]
MSHTSSAQGACLLVIGNEILSGRTQDRNIQFLALALGEHGLPLREVRVIPDVRETIIATVNETRARFAHVLTTGGIGPTHDDITSECVAAAFGVPWEPHPEAWALMEAHYPPGGFNAARQRMATMPRGATLIANPVSLAPGFSIGNVHVMAGIPSVMQAMFQDLVRRLPAGLPVLSRTVHAWNIAEGTIAADLAALQLRWPDVEIGSYPFQKEENGKKRIYGIAIVAKGTDPRQLDEIAVSVIELFKKFNVSPVLGELDRSSS